MKLCSAQTMTTVNAMLKELSTTIEDPPAELVILATQDFSYF